MAKTAKPLRIIRPNTKKPIKESVKQLPASKPEAEKKAEVNKGDTGTEKLIAPPADNKENATTWSEWLWSDQDAGFYYRARKVRGDTWQYEYTAGLSSPSLEDLKIDDGCSSQFNPPIEYMEPEEEVIYVTEKAYSYPHSSNGESLHQVDGVSGDTMMETVEEDTSEVPSPPPTDTVATEHSAPQEKATTAEPEAKTRTLADRVRRDNKKSPQRGPVKEKGRGPSRVDIWIENVDRALGNEASGLHPPRENDSEENTLAGHGKTRKAKNKEHKSRRKEGRSSDEQ